MGDTLGRHISFLLFFFIYLTLVVTCIFGLQIIFCFYCQHFFTVLSVVIVRYFWDLNLFFLICFIYFVLGRAWTWARATCGCQF